MNWDGLPKRLTRLSEEQKSQVVWRLLSFLLFPKRDGHNSRQRARLRVFEIFWELDKLKRNSPRSHARFAALNSELSTLGVPKILVNAKSKNYYYKQKVSDNWIRWCSIFAQYELLYRAADAVSGISLNKVRWALLLSRSQLPYPIEPTRIKFIRASTTTKSTPHLIMGALSCVTLKKNEVPTLRELHRACVADFPRFITAILTYQKFLSEFRVSRSRGKKSVVSEKRLLFVPATASFSVRGPRRRLSHRELLLIERYDPIRYNKLSPVTAKIAYKEIVNSPP